MAIVFITHAQRYLRMVKYPADNQIDASPTHTSHAPDSASGDQSVYGTAISA